MARPKSEGFVRKAEAQRRVKTSKPKLTPNARYQQQARKQVQGAIKTHKKVLTKHGVDLGAGRNKKEQAARRQRVRYLRYSSPEVKRSFQRIAEAVTDASSARRDNHLNFQRQLRGPQPVKLEHRRRFTIEGSLGKIPLVGSEPRKKRKYKSPYAPKRRGSYSPPSRNTA